MSLVMTPSRDLRTRRETRILFQGLHTDSKLQIIPHRLHLKAEELVVEQEFSIRGGFGEVAKGRYRGELVAVKSIRRDIGFDDAERYTKFVYETLMWKSVKHERLLHLYGVSVVRRQSCDVLPGGYGSPSRQTRFYRIFVYRWLLQVVERLEDLAVEGVVHGDIHPKNILVVKPRSGRRDDLDFDIVITDFGLSVYADGISGQNNSSRGGRWNYMAPELQFRTGQREAPRPTKESDAFAWAATAYALYTTQDPYNDNETGIPTPGEVVLIVRELQLPNNPVKKMVAGELRTVSVPPDLWRIIVDCWKGPNDRLTIDEINTRLRPIQNTFDVPI